MTVNEESWVFGLLVDKTVKRNSSLLGSGKIVISIFFGDILWISLKIISRLIYNES